ncbi:MAG: thioredoxin [Kineosporiaceae bacterium]|nr:thioredoxin [Kineosporiaceae bacterium]
MSASHAVTDATFDQEVLGSDKPVLVDFWAPWCAPCRQVAPILDEISAAHGDKLTIVKVNTDENAVVVGRYGVTSIPTLAVFAGGELVKTIVGAKPKPKLLQELSTWID